MATTIENILGGGKKPAAQTPPATSPPPTPDKEGLKISDEEKKGVSPAQAMPTTKQTEPPQQPKRMSYEDMFKKLNPYQPPTEQELEKERKKQRREQIFAAIYRHYPTFSSPRNMPRTCIQAVTRLHSGQGNAGTSSQPNATPT